MSPRTHSTMSVIGFMAKLCVAFRSSATAGLPGLNAFLTEFTSKVHNRPIPQPSSSSAASKPKNSVDPTPDPSRPASPHHPTPSQTAQLKRELENQATGEVTREEVNALRGDQDAPGVQEVPWRVTVGGGCQDLLFKAFGAIFNPGDAILVETPVYAGVISQFMTLEVEQVEVQVDDQGVSPDSLRDVLASWPEGKAKPKAMYVVPVGSNPTGCSSTTERKLEILKICVDNGIMILEDDPYYFLAADLRPSYFQLETQVVPEGGHVVRFDSFSKVLSSGMRLVSRYPIPLRVAKLMSSPDVGIISLQGFAAGPEAILKAMDTASSTANLQPNGVAQAVALRLLRYCKWRRALPIRS